MIVRSSMRRRSRARRRSPVRAGKKPTKRNSSLGSPEAEREASRADGPGIGTTGMWCRRQSVTRRWPGSETSGIRGAGRLGGRKLRNHAEKSRMQSMRTKKEAGRDAGATEERFKARVFKTRHYKEQGRAGSGETFMTRASRARGMLYF